MEQLPHDWEIKTEALYFAFQPIVNIHTGVTLGFEALLRGWEKAGFSGIDELFNKAYSDEILYGLDLRLRKLLVETFFTDRNRRRFKLFYNLDNRVLEMPDYNPGNTGVMLREHDVFRNNLCFEISEKHEFSSYSKTSRILNNYKNQHYRIAIDDFGAGYAGLTLLYHARPDYIKVDRFFIESMNSDRRKMFFVSSIVRMAHMMGIAVIAEGVENESEYGCCLDAGCDYVQGYIVCRPEVSRERLLDGYPEAGIIALRHSSQEASKFGQISDAVKKVRYLTLDTSADMLLDFFRSGYESAVIPVLNSAGEPAGLLLEQDLRKYVYSQYGISILRHRIAEDGLESILRPAPVMESASNLDRIVELFSEASDTEQIIITENGKYLGILDSTSILRLVSGRNAVREGSQGRHRPQDIRQTAEKTA